MSDCLKSRWMRGFGGRRPPHSSLLKQLLREDQKHMARHIRIIGLLALLPALLALPDAALAQSLTLAPEQPSVAAGQTLGFVGTGFKRDEKVAIWATAPDQTVIGGDFAYAKGDEGRIEFGFKVPEDAIGGRWAMTAYGLDTKVPVIANF